MICSVFTADQPRVQGKGAYGFDDCYAIAQFSQPQLDALWEKHGVKAEDRDTFLAQEVNLHRILQLTKDQDARGRVGPRQFLASST